MVLSTTRFRNTTWTLIVAGIFTYILAAIAADPLHLNGDSALHIQAAERILQGGHASVDAIDTNPPLIMYLTVLPTAAAHAIGMHPIPAFLLAVWLFTMATTFATRQLLLGALPQRESNHANFLAASLALASLALLVRGEFGQREHLFVFGILPFFVVRFRRWEAIPTSRLVAIVTGVVAGIGASIKPQLAVIVLVPELYWLLAYRTPRPLFSPEVLSAFGAAAAYLAHFLLWPDIGDAFFGRWVPLLITGFGAFNATFEAILLLHYAEWLPVAVAVPTLLLRAPPHDVAWRLTRPLAAAAVTAAVVFVAQHKGWTYHAVPIRVLAFALMALIAAQILLPGMGRESEPSLTSVIPVRLIEIGLAGAIVLAVATALMTIGPSARSQLESISQSALAREIIANARADEPVLLLSTDAWDCYPLLVQIRRTQASRFLFAFPVALLYNHVTRDPERPFPYRGVNGVPMPTEEARFQNEMKADIEHHRPKIILIDTKETCLACPEGFSLYTYFERTGFLANAMAAYSRSRNVDRFATFLPKH